jgi:hypothetical protein
MSRPLYESKKDLDSEKEVIEQLGEKWNCSFAKMPIRYHLDYVLKKDDKALAFCEVKTRSYTMQKIGEMGGYLMSIGKWSSAKSLYDCSGLPFILIVKTLDGIWWSIFKEFNPDNVLVRGRTDRNDWQDIEPCVLLDIKKFKKL